MDVTSRSLSVANPFLWACKVIGLTPFSVDWKTCSLKTGALDKAIAAVAAVLQVVITYQSLSYFIGIQNIPLLIPWGYASGSSALLLLSTFAEWYYNVNKQNRILTLIRQCDQSLFSSREDLTTTVKRCMKLNAVFVVFTYIIYSSYWITKPMTFTSVITAACVIWSKQFLIINLLRFVNLTLLINNRFVRLISVIKNSKSLTLFPNNKHEYKTEQSRQTTLGHFKSVSTIGQCDLEEPEPDIMSLMKVYDALCDIVDLTVEVHQNFLSLLLLMMLFLSTGITYLLFSKATFTSQFSSTELLSTYFIPGFMGTIMLLMILVPPHITAVAANNILRVVWQRLLSKSKNDKEVPELRELAQFIRDRKVSFRLFGILTIDLRLLAGCISILTTYSVIVLTFNGTTC